MRANEALSLTEWFSTLKSHSSRGEFVGLLAIAGCFNVTPEGSALSTGGALLDGGETLRRISRSASEFLAAHPSV